jgi:anthranilate/para-aminobenzoate synthase component I
MASRLKVLTEQVITTPALSDLLAHPDFGAALRDSLAASCNVSLTHQCIACFVQDNRQRVVKPPNPTGKAGEHAFGQAPEPLVRISLMFRILPVDVSPMTREQTVAENSGRILVVPFRWPATIDDPGASASTETMTLAYEMRIDLEWWREDKCTITFRTNPDFDPDFRSTRDNSIQPLGFSWRCFLDSLASLHQLDSNTQAPPRSRAHVPMLLGTHEATRLTAAIGRIQEEIDQGGCYLVNLTTVVPLQPEALATSPEAFLGRWGRSPSRFGWYLNTPLCALESYSPERHFKITNGIISTEPIKGTVVLSDKTQGGDVLDPTAFIEAASKLWESEKERCEQHLVIDLLRNDLASVCKSGTVAVVSPLEVRFCSGLGQMTSVIAGSLQPNLSMATLLERLLPAGSVTGAPKKAVCSLLQSLETQPRGLYCGICLDAESPERMDATLLIRTLFRAEERTWAGTGAGITALSDPRAEVEEMERKLASFLARCTDA